MPIVNGGGSGASLPNPITTGLNVQPTNTTDQLLYGFTAETSTAALINVSDWDGSNGFTVVPGGGPHLTLGGSIIIEARPAKPTRFVFGVDLANLSAPADGDLTAGQCVLWFDDTNGAAKMMVKAKQADGTVVTGSVNLT